MQAAAFSSGLAPLRQEGHALCHHFVFAAFLTILRLPPTLLEPAIDDHPIAFAQILPAMFRLLSEYDNIDEADFFLQFFRLLEAPTGREPEAGDRCPARCIP